MALFNYSHYSGTRSCLISGWKITKVSVSGNRVFRGSIAVGAITNSATAGRIDASNDIVAY